MPTKGVGGNGCGAPPFKVPPAGFIGEGATAGRAASEWRFPSEIRGGPGDPALLPPGGVSPKFSKKTGHGRWLGDET
jgi:hypothetical protein